MQSGSEDAELTALLQMEAEEEARLADEERDFTVLAKELEHDKNTNWLRGCEWPRWFAHKPLHLITSTATTPLPLNKDRYLGS